MYMYGVYFFHLCMYSKTLVEDTEGLHPSWTVDDKIHKVIN